MASFYFPVAWGGGATDVAGLLEPLFFPNALQIFLHLSIGAPGTSYSNPNPTD